MWRQPRWSTSGRFSGGGRRRLLRRRFSRFVDLVGVFTIVVIARRAVFVVLVVDERGGNDAILDDVDRAVVD